MILQKFVVIVAVCIFSVVEAKGGGVGSGIRGISSWIRGLSSSRSSGEGFWAWLFGGSSGHTSVHASSRILPTLYYNPSATFPNDSNNPDFLIFPNGSFNGAFFQRKKATVPISTNHLPVQFTVSGVSHSFSSDSSKTFPDYPFSFNEPTISPFKQHELHNKQQNNVPAYNYQNNEFPPPPPNYLPDRPPKYYKQFGSSGLATNTYIYNNFYGDGETNETEFLVKALIKPEMNWTWSVERDREWRQTVHAKYFENKVPGGNETLPAAAVIGAATAFGLKTLLPLLVPRARPLMYCKSNNIAHNPILFHGRAYSCLDGKVAVTCPRVLQEDGSFRSSRSCNPRNLDCVIGRKYISYGNVSCALDGALVTNFPMLCAYTVKLYQITIVDGILVSETKLYIKCFDGPFDERRASFIPRPIHKMTLWERISYDHQPYENRWVPEAIKIPKRVFKGSVILKHVTKVNSSTEDYDYV